MRLTAINLCGFKSFCDRTTVLVKENLIGVVGPNGCGKSNIIDALRWGLGESRASFLRGGALQDVLFNGSANRPPADLCYVEIHFNVEEGDELGMWQGNPQIVVKRELGRDGESHFYINDQQVRRRDVVSLFRGTGVSPRSYAVVEQGMVGGIAEASADSLRQFLEEAAGVSHYKDRRRDAERRLTSCRANLEQLGQLLAESTKRQESLKRQARAARRHRELGESINDLEVLLILQNRDSVREKLAAKDGEITALNEQIAAVRTHLDSLRKDAENARAQHGEYQRKSQACEADFARAQSAAERAQQDYQQAEQKRSQLQERIAAEQAEQAETAETAKQIITEQRQAETELGGIGGRLEKCIAESERYSDEIDALQESQRTAEQDMESARARLQEAEQRRDRRQVQAQMNAEKKQTMEERVAELQTSLPPESPAAPPPVEDAEQRTSQCEETLAAREAECKQLTQAEQSARAALHDAQNTQAAAEAEHTALQSMRQTEEWKDDAPPRLSAAMKADAGEWSRALDAALGRFAAAYAPSSLDKFLNTRGMPPAGAGVVDMRGGNGDHSPTNGQKPLFSLIKAPPEATAFLAAKLRGVYAADSAEAALAARKDLQDGEMLMTRDGALFMRDAVFSPAEVRGGFAWQKRLATLADSISDNEKKIQQLQTAADDARDKLQAAETSRAQAATALDTARAELSDRRIAMGQWEERQRAAEQRREEVLAEISGIESRVEELDAESNKLADPAAMERDCTDATTALAAAKKITDDAAAKLETRRDEFHQSNISRRELHLREENLKQQIESLTTRGAEVAKRQKALSARVSQNENELAQFAETALTGTMTRHNDDMAKTKTALKKAAAETDAWAQKITAADNEREKQLRESEQLQEKNTALQVQKRELSMSTEGLENSLEDLVQDETRLEPLRQTPATSEERREEIDALRTKRERLGAINFAADQELADGMAQLETMQSQKQDVESAADELENIIRRIDAETRTRLRDVYETINREFGGLFRKLFGGGEAELSMDGDSFLDAQFEIRARPPGKRMFPVRMLSGGEKSATALAFIFALMRHTPPPFCIMDEVDATLDDSRADLFIAMLGEMSTHFQCMAITHNKSTVEAMSQLIGVTQEEKGVSKIVSVTRADVLRDIS